MLHLELSRCRVELTLRHVELELLLLIVLRRFTTHNWLAWLLELLWRVKLTLTIRKLRVEAIWVELRLASWLLTRLLLHELLLSKLLLKLRLLVHELLLGERLLH